MKHAVSLAFVAAMMAAPASAAVVDVVITGVVATGAIDGADYWSGALVDDAGFTARFTYDTSLGIRSTAVNGSPADLLSGSANSPEGLPISATLTVGTQTRAMASPAGAYVNRDHGLAFVQPSAHPGEPYDFNWARYSLNTESYDDQLESGPVGQLHLDVYALLGTLPTSIETGYVFAADPNAQPQAIGSIHGVWVLSIFDDLSDTWPYSYAALSGNRISVTVRDPVSPVPLPASAPLLVLGAAALAGLRVARRKPKLI